jgi:hypothetical protein
MHMKNRLTSMSKELIRIPIMGMLWIKKLAKFNKISKGFRDKRISSKMWKYSI